MKKSINLMVLMFLTFSLIAQNKYFYTVNFNSDQYNLEAKEMTILDDLIRKAENAGYFELEISAHTDDVGSIAYNEKLSKNRAMEVKNYLISKGQIPVNYISTNWKGELKPVAQNNSDIGRHSNRRVEIVLTTYKINSPEELLKTISGNFTQVFIINSNKKNEIIGEKGIKVVIPENAFVKTDGTPVKDENITFELMEFHSLGDAIFNGLTTQSNGKIIESGGMMKLTAKLDGSELSLANNKRLEVELPSTNIQPEMKVFVGSRNDEGFVEWNQTNNDFKVNLKDQANHPSLELDNHLLKQHLILDFNQGTKDDNKFLIEINIPVLPFIPKKPVAPVKPTYPDPNSMVKAIFRPFTPKAIKVNKADKLYGQKMHTYERKLKSYNRKMESFNQYIVQNGIDLIKYEMDLNDFDSYLDSIYNAVENEKETHKKAYDIVRWNRAIKKLILENNNENLKINNGLNYFINLTSIYYPCAELANLVMIQKKSNYVSFLKDKSYDEIKSMAVDGKITVQVGKVHLRLKNSETYENKNYQSFNAISASQINTADLRLMFSEAQLKRHGKMEAMGLLTLNEVNSVYRASLPQMGYVNCDRFSTVPENLMVRVNITKKEGEQVTFVLSKSNSVLQPWRDSKNINEVYLKVPKSEKIKMLVVGVENGKPVFEERNLNLSKETRISTQAKQLTLAEIRENIMKI
jgi:hypothetical protein